MCTINESVHPELAGMAKNVFARTNAYNLKNHQAIAYGAN
jgi:hypothetical protein